MFFADAALARRLELNKSTAALAYAGAQERLRPGTTAVLPIAGGNAVFVGAASPISRATGLGMQAPISPTDLDDVEAFFRSRSMGPKLELCPLAHPSLLALVRERGYRIDHVRNVLVRPLTPGEQMPAPTPGVSVTRAVTPAEKREWTLTVTRGFLGRDDVVPEETWIAQPMTEVDAVTCCVARLEGEPVGGGAMAIRGGLACLSSTSVRPAFHGQGVQSALLSVRLAAAVAAGCDLAMAEASPGSSSQRNLERFGFRVVYTSMTVVQD